MVPKEIEKASYLALDPGETTGWAIFDDAGIVLEYGQFSQKDQNQWLDKVVQPHLKAVIVEDYMNYAWQKQKRWAKNQTSKNIGSVEMVCSMRNVPVFLQPANIKKIGYKWAGLGEAPTNHAISHQFDAVAHGTYWLVLRKVRNPEVPND